MPTSDDIVAAARSMVGVKFQHQGRLPSIGLDCAGHVISAAAMCGITIEDIRGYQRVPSGPLLTRHMHKVLIPIPLSDADIGCVAEMIFDRWPTHVGILAEMNGIRTIVHSSWPAKKVIETTLDDKLSGRILRVYRIPGVDY